MKRTKITAWSYSRLKKFEGCPRQFEYAEILKMDEPKPEAMWHGIKVHEEAAKFLSGETDVFPESCINFEEEFRELRKLRPIVEQKWAFSRKWRSVSYFHQSVKSRFVLDVCHIYKDGEAEVIDHKTGQYKDNSVDEYRDQLLMFAGIVCRKHPEVHTVTARLWFLEADEEYVEEIDRKTALAALDDLEKRAYKMMDAEKFPPNPSWRCGGVSKKTGKPWGCHWRASNGGPCEYG